jgi:hypothetical protein
MGGRFFCSRESQVHVADGLVDLLGVLESDRRAVYARILESKPHRLCAVVVTILELATTAELHADHSKLFFL